MIIDTIVHGYRWLTVFVLAVPPAEVTKLAKTFSVSTGVPDESVSLPKTPNTCMVRRCCRARKMEIQVRKTIEVTTFDLERIGYTLKARNLH